MNAAEQVDPAGLVPAVNEIDKLGGAKALPPSAPRSAGCAASGACRKRQDDGAPAGRRNALVEEICAPPGQARRGRTSATVFMNDAL